MHQSFETPVPSTGPGKRVHSGLKGRHLTSDKS